MEKNGTGTKAGPQVINAEKWGLPAEAVDGLGRNLYSCWERFGTCFRTKTRDTSEWAHVYLKGLLLLEGERNYANIARRVLSSEDDGQALQQFMSDSPWRSSLVFSQIRQEICSRPSLHQGVLSLDETGDERAGELSAGAARQYLGRYGKTDVGQVGVVLSYSLEDLWTLVDAELYFPRHWFDDAHAELRRRLHVPESRTFATKPAIGLEMVRRVRADGLPFVAVAADAVYGRDGDFRKGLDEDGILYAADVPSDYPVYLERPEVGVPQRQGDRGRQPTCRQVLNGVESVTVASLIDEKTPWQSLVLRQGERGPVEVSCWTRQVWTITSDWEVRQEWLLAHRQAGDKLHFSLSNAPGDASAETMMQWRGQRYFVERAIQDSKSELGWDEFMAQKYRAWMHHAALNALALWFVMSVRIDWAEKHPRAADLKEQLGLNKLPALSVANIKELLKSVIKLPRLTPEQARHLVCNHLNNRARATRSRFRQHQRQQQQAASAKPKSPDP